MCAAYHVGVGNGAVQQDSLQEATNLSMTTSEIIDLT